MIKPWGICTLIILSVSLAEARTLVSQTMGVAGGRVYTSREIHLSLIMDRLIEGKGKEPALPKPGALPDTQAVGHVLLEAAVAREAETFALETAAADAEAWAAKTKAWLEARPEAKALGYDNEEIQRLAQEKSRARGFIRLKSESMKGLVTEAEAEAYFEQNRVKFGQMPFSAFRENIVSFLSQQRMEERLRSWFEILRRKHRVREYQVATRN